MKRFSAQRCRHLASVLAVLAASPAVHAAEVDRIDATGLGSTSTATLSELLPRSPPAIYSDNELREFERRLRNLVLFDRVRVRLVDRVLVVEVDRKDNIEGDVEASTGATVRDADVETAMLHHDIDGRASTFGAGVGYGERFAQFRILFNQHPYRARRWSWDADGFYGGSEVRFVDAPVEWVRARVGGSLYAKPPYSYATPFRFRVGAHSYAERSVFAEGGTAPPDGLFIGSSLEAYFDRWTFHDLAPSGVLLTIRLVPGWLVGPRQARHSARTDLVAALPIHDRTVLTARAVGEMATTANPNYGLLLGSQTGVRGLPDTLLRDAAHVFGNVELRHAIELARRLYLQPILFFDAAKFRPMDAEGRPTRWLAAYSCGAGIRLIPTEFIDMLVRVDVARMLAPSRTWFVQVGLEQYF